MAAVRLKDSSALVRAALFAIEVRGAWEPVTWKLNPPADGEVG